MTTVVIDAVLRSKLGNLAESVQIEDESGRVLGHFLPILDAPQREAQISQEEIELRLHHGGGRSFADIMQDLGKRA